MSNKFISKYQCAVFGNFDEISATPEIVKIMVESFMVKQLLPTQYQEQSIAVSKDQIKHETKARISLKSFDQKFEIRFLPDRCDFLYTDFIDENSFTVEMFVSKVKEYLSIVSEKFTKLYNRIGLVVESYYDNISLADTIKNFNTPIESLSESNYVEWSNRIVIRKILATIDEPLNHSVENNYMEGEITIRQKSKNFKGLRNIIDINTLIQDSSNRFDYQKVCIYLDEVIPIYKKLQSENSQIIV
ncbi:hypothetical protein [Sphingobacterium multivorum]|uniref:hypothetical protein n=1 Tax=Sphingobacterium TaxID=28453 RepID=UPI00289E5C22|nr:hypothetical protein [Sphingobacterium multivorum]